MRTKYKMLFAAGLAALAAGTVQAQTTVAGGTEAGDQTDIVVTARMRSEKLKDIPDTITAFSAEVIARSNINNVKDFVALTPNVTLLPSFRQGVFNLTARGDSTPQGGDSPIVVNFDGVQAPALDLINQDLFDIERIEVLKGPQSALYGQGASAGAINIYTKAPGNDLEGFAKASYGNGDTYRLAAGVGGPIVPDHLFVRVAGFRRHSDGLIPNVTLGTKADFFSAYGVRARTVAVYGDFKADARIGYTDTKNGFAYETIIPYSTTDRIDPDVSDLKIRSNLPSRERTRLFSTSLKLDYALDAGTITSVTGYSRSRESGFGDLDFGPAQILTQHVGFRVRAFNSELRFTSDGSSALRYVVGAFFQKRRIFNIAQIPSYLDDGGPVPTRLDDPRLQGPFLLNGLDVTKSRSWALFANLIYKLTDRLELTLAARYDEDRRTAESLTAGPVSRSTKTFARLQPKASLAFHATPDALFYLTYGQGFRSGSFNPYLSAADRLIRAEVTDNYEAGTKLDLLDNSVSLNASLYHIKFSNRPYYYFLADGGNSSQNIVTIASATSDGVEIDLSARPVDGLTVQASYGVVLGRVKRFDATDMFIGNDLPDTPNYTMNASADYRLPVSSDVDALLHVGARRQGRIFYDLANRVATSPKTFVDARIALERGGWSLAGFVQNLTNERFLSNFTPTAAGIAFVQPNQPRAYGIELSAKF
ncbi:TonB-dependent receptor [Sphingomonas histidinilytica]|uniref:TonB-dependent receptor n=1 Tax=Rhizorhabdus histidinilytica TaxID=439228 RepID=UPI001ADB532F|nr:TonB-dependent receptor [Rhizorhabdus histidinilytica]MBO9375623.1 TonB-dependent receptor [Rhizorhabdus histidinilytica]